MSDPTTTRPATAPPTAPHAPRRVHVRTWGCQMNVYDSSRMVDLLAPLGYAATEAADLADLIILNTCHIREKAAEKVFSELGRLRALKRAREAEGGRLLIAVAGCVAQAEGAEILARAPLVDLVIGPQNYQDLPALLAAAEAGERRVATDFPAEPKFDRLPEEGQPTGPTAFLAVQEGCDKFCTFCVVPYTRGAEYSRPAAAILAEARRLLAQGAREITLLGQNVNAWAGAAPTRHSSWGLGRLIQELAALPGLARLRYTTSHPRDMDEALIEAHATVPQLMPWLHLPVQSGSDRILKAMNRKHTAAAYLDLVARLRAARPDLALSGDFIVGFPGETDRDYADTLALVSEVGYAQAYSFKYSARPGTPAADLPDQVPEPVKAERLAGLQQLLGAQQMAFNRRLVGRRTDILFDRAGQRPGQLLGRSPWMQSVHAEAPARLMGELVEVEVTEAHPNSLAARVLTREAA